MEPAATDAAPAPDSPAASSPGRTQQSVLARTATGMGWIVGWRMVTRVLGLCNTLILVRLLLPSDFGLVALGTGFALAVDMLSVLGVEDALVRERAPTRAMYDSAFTMSALRSLATAVVIAAVAVPIGRFFGEPRLANVLYALAAGALIQGAGNIGVIDFRREMEFHKEFVLQVLPRILSIVVTIACALIWHSYWALVAGILANRTGRTVFSYRMHPYRPKLTLRAWRSLIGFSVWTWAVCMVTLVRDRMDTFVIGRVLNAAHVGMYSIGEEVAALPTTELVAPLGRACFSGFTAARYSGGSVAETYMRAVSTTFLLTLPAGLGVSLLADPLVRLAVGSRWVEAIPVIQVLGVMGALTVFGNVAGVLFSVFGVLRLQFLVGAACVVARLLLLLPLVARYGIVGAAIGSLLGAGIEQAALAMLAFRRFHLGYRVLLRRVWRILLAAAIMTAVLCWTGFGWHATAGSGLRLAAQLLAASGLGALVYGLALLLLWQACGRPQGAEADLLGALRGLLGYAVRRAAQVRWRASGLAAKAR